VRNRYVLIADVVGIAVAAFGAFALRFDWFFIGYRREFVPFLIVAIAVKVSVFYAFGMYRRYWRYPSRRDLFALVVAVVAGSFFTATPMIIGLAIGYFDGVSRSVLFIDGLLTLVIAVGIRGTISLVSDRSGWGRPPQATGSARRVLVVGAGDAGTLVVREMQRNPQLGMVPVGFLDDARIKRDKRIYGVPVVAAIQGLEAAVLSYSVDEVIIAMPRASGAVVRRVIDSCRRAAVPSRTIPGVYELIGGSVSVNKLRNVDITDLLRRSQVAMPQSVMSHITGRTVLVTGAGGSIGLELCRQLAAGRPSLLILLGHGENSIFEARMHLAEAFPEVKVAAAICDVRDRHRLTHLVRSFRPEIVFHAAAHKHVPLMEENPEEAISNNVVGTANLVAATIDAEVRRLVLVSTDKAVAPISMMGASKRVAEAIVLDAAKRTGRAFAVVRFGNVLGSRGSVVTTFRRQLERGGPITLTHPEMTRYFMTIPEAVHLVLEASGMTRGGELFVLRMGDPVKIVDLARDLIRLSGFTAEEMPIVFSGVRPGEKMTEQLWEKDATVVPTVNTEILSIVEPELTLPTSVEQMVQSLARTAESGSRLELQALLAACVPSYSPHMSDPLSSALI
jgi:FlaA1/EpsC-like NDP-sugar epimerase